MIGPARTGVVGAGAIGTIVAAHLARTGDVTLFTRHAEEARRIAADGLRLGETHPQSVDVTPDPDDAARCDVLVVAVKTTATRGLTPFARAFHGTVLTLQNGIGNDVSLKAVFGEGAGIALGPTTIGGTRRAAGSVTNVSIGPTTIGWASGGRAASALADVTERFRRAGLPVALVDDVRPALWAKLIVNGAINAVAALARVPNGALLGDSELHVRVTNLAREGAAVAAALGIALPYVDAVAHVEATVAATAANRNSMLQDLDAGRATEIDAINGAIVAAADAVGVAVPEHRRVVAQVARAEAERSG